jgi:hypothetical protein
LIGGALPIDRALDARDLKGFDQPLPVFAVGA